MWPDKNLERLFIKKLIYTLEGQNVGILKYAYWSKKNQRHSQGKFDVATLSGLWAFGMTEEQTKWQIHKR